MRGRYTEKDVAIKLIECRDLMDFFDDGHHIKEYFYLVKMSNELFSMLSEPNQKAFQRWIEKKIQKELKRRLSPLLFSSFASDTCPIIENNKGDVLYV